MDIADYDIDCGFMKTRKDFHIKILTPEDKDKIINLLCEYYKSEPTTSQSKLSLREAYKLSEIWFNTYVHQGLSIGLFNKTSSELAAIVINRVRCTNKQQIHLQEENYPSKVLQEADNLEEYMLANIFDELNVSKYFELSIVCVSSCYRNIGAATECTKIAEMVASSTDCSLIVANPSNFYMNKLLEKLGYAIEKEVQYKTWVDPSTGVKTFENMQNPHVCTRVMYKSIAKLKYSN